MIDSQLRGCKDGFVICDMLDPGTFRGSVLIDFDLPASSEGRRVLNALNEAYHVVPRSAKIPGADGKLRRYSGFIPKSSLVHLVRDAEFVSELARLARDKRAPGATRTRIAWWAYRLRHLNSQSRWERFALIIYRALGYGERPIPAFLSWFVLALVATSVVLWGSALDFSWDGASIFIAELVSQALAPFGSITGTGNPDASSLEYALRPLIAVPLITGALALRNSVKQERYLRVRVRTVGRCTHMRFPQRPTVLTNSPSRVPKFRFLPEVLANLISD